MFIQERGQKSLKTSKLFVETIPIVEQVHTNAIGVVFLGRSEIRVNAR